MKRDKISVVLAEFMGTALLATVVLVVANMFGSGTAAWYISLSAGAVLAAIVGMFGSVSGAHVNPAVTLGLWSLKKIETTTAIVYATAQMLGGAVAYSLYTYFSDKEIFAIADTSFSSQVFLAEVLGSVVFGMGIAAAVTRKLEGYFAAFTIGASLTFGALVASMAAAGFLNPAVALANNSLTSMYLFAPLVGIPLGMQVYQWAFAPQSAASVPKLKVTRKKK